MSFFKDLVGAFLEVRKIEGDCDRMQVLLKRMACVYVPCRSQGGSVADAKVAVFQEFGVSPEFSVPAFMPYGRLACDDPLLGEWLAIREIANAVLVYHKVNPMPSGTLDEEKGVYLAQAIRGSAWNIHFYAIPDAERQGMTPPPVLREIGMRSDEIEARYLDSLDRRCTSAPGDGKGGGVSAHGGRSVMSTAEVKCPGCGAEYSLGEEYWDKNAVCPNCEVTFSVPIPTPTSAIISDVLPPGPSASEESLPSVWKKGDVIGGRYEVHSILGEGGFGVVYLVFARDIQQVCALKTFRGELLPDPAVRKAFKKEALAWVNLEIHPFIIAAALVDELSGRLFIAMEPQGVSANKRQSWSVATNITGARLFFGSAHFAQQVRDMAGAPT